jgi:hypothetical protein
MGPTAALERFYICAASKIPIRMTQVWFSIGHFFQWTFNKLLVPMGWLPVILIAIVMTIGTIYWLRLQGKYNRKAREKGESI